jgi:Plavaka transposase
MYEWIEKFMPRGPGWKTETIILEDTPDEPQTLHYQDIVECAEYLLSDPTFSNGMMYEPVRLFDAKGTTCFYHEMNTGEIWNEQQVSS